MGEHVRDTNFIVIQAFMRNDLQLKGNELMAYAIIYGFTQDGEQWFHGSRAYIADWLGCSRKTVSTTLDALVEKGLVEKRTRIENRVTFCDYRVSFFHTPVKKLPHPLEKTSPPPLEKTSPHNIEIDNLEDNLEREKRDEAARGKRKRFTPPTLEEVEAYCDERENGIDPQQFVDYYESNGWKVGRNSMRDWKAAVRTWERRDGTAPKKPRKSKGRKMTVDELMRFPSVCKTEEEARAILEDDGNKMAWTQWWVDGDWAWKLDNEGRQ